MPRHACFIKGLRLVVHGDDFTILGYEQDLDWFWRQSARSTRLSVVAESGPTSAMTSIRILSRMVEWTEDGLNCEAD